jgi:hypothetical protein
MEVATTVPTAVAAITAVAVAVTAITAMTTTAMPVLLPRLLLRSSHVQHRYVTSVHAVCNSAVL